MHGLIVIFTKNVCDILRDALLLDKGINLGTLYILLVTTYVEVNSNAKQLRRFKPLRKHLKEIKDACFHIGGWAT